jgi:hypothetical protein
MNKFLCSKKKTPLPPFWPKTFLARLPSSRRRCALSLYNVAVVRLLLPLQDQIPPRSSSSSSVVRIAVRLVAGVQMQPSVGCLLLGLVVLANLGAGCEYFLVEDLSIGRGSSDL